MLRGRIAQEGLDPEAVQFLDPGHTMQSDELQPTTKIGVEMMDWRTSLMRRTAEVQDRDKIGFGW
jgi:hypothetical protein